MIFNYYHFDVSLIIHCVLKVTKRPGLEPSLLLRALHTKKKVRTVTHFIDHQNSFPLRTLNSSEQLCNTFPSQT